MNIVRSCLKLKCRRRGREESEDDDNSSFGYSVAISNTLFREAETGGVSGGRGSMPPCMNCVLIEMGEMVCYTGQWLRDHIWQVTSVLSTQKSVQTVAEYPPGGGRNQRKDSNGSENYQPEKMDRSSDNSSRLVMSSVEIFKNTFRSSYWQKFFLLIIKFCTWNVSKKIFNKSFEDQQ